MLGRFLTVGSAAALLALGAGCKSKPTEASFRLANGLSVDLVATPRGVKVAVVVLYDVGTVHDPPGRSGMAHLLEHLLFTAGAGSRPSRTVEETIQRYPLGWNAQTGTDYTVLSVVVPPGRLGDELDDAAARMAGLKLEAPDLERERPRVLEELEQMRGGDPALGAINFAAEAIRPTPGQGWRGGIAGEIQAIELSELRAFWSAHYKAANARLVVVGRFDAEEARARVEKAFGGVPAGKRPEARGASDSRVTGTLVMGDAPTAVAVAVAAPAPTDPEYPAFLVLATRLAEAKEPKRAFRLEFTPLDRPEVLLVIGKLEEGETADAAAARLREEIDDLIARPLSEGEAARALSTYGFFLGTAPLSPEAYQANPYGIAFGRGRRAQLGIDPAALKSAFGALTAERLAKAAQRFAPANSVAVAAGGVIR